MKKLKKSEEGKLFSRVEDLRQEFNNLSEKPTSPVPATNKDSFKLILSMKEEFEKLCAHVEIRGEKLHEGEKPFRMFKLPRLMNPLTKEILNKPDERAPTPPPKDIRFDSILETFNNIGEFLLLCEKKTVITNPKNFCQVLVEDIINHEILNQEKDNVDLDELTRLLYEKDKIDPKESTNLLSKGFL